jgi:hypothetical protein
MPKLSKQPLSLAEIPSIDLLPVINMRQQLYEYLVIPSESIQSFTKAVLEVSNVYAQFAKQAHNAVQELFQQQQRFAEALYELLNGMSMVTKMNIVIRTPIMQDISRLSSFPMELLQPTQIFVQPNQRYVPEKVKALPSPKRKQDVSLAMIQVEGNGFTLDGEYIRGMTRKSKTGRLFELMIRRDLAGMIDDESIEKITNIASGDYRARGFVLRDLKDILAGNKIELNMERYVGIGKYKINNLIKRIRKSKNKKRLLKQAK